MCRFCRGDYIPADILIASKVFLEEAAATTGVILATENETKQNCMIFKVNGTDTKGAIKINYCPLCGERLE